MPASCAAASPPSDSRFHSSQNPLSGAIRDRAQVRSRASHGRLDVFDDARKRKPQLLMLFSRERSSCSAPRQRVSTPQTRSRWNFRGGRQRAVQSEVHPMTEFDWKPLRTRVIARDSLVMLRIPAQTSSRNGGERLSISVGDPAVIVPAGTRALPSVDGPGERRPSPAFNRILAVAG